MDLLILGGTQFVGRHLTETALNRGHRVHLFHRGRTGSDLFPHATRIYGDRDGGLDALRGHRWDAVIDTCGYVPRLVGDAARVAADSSDHYTFISTLSVYASLAEYGQDESAPLGQLAEETEEVNGETYGPLKVACEGEVEHAMPGRNLIVRPGLIVGPHDPTDRFSYWPHRFNRGGKVLAPGRPDRPVQWIDVRDLAEWIVDMTEQKQTGIFHAVVPEGTYTMGDFLHACAQAGRSDTTPVWVSDSFLMEQNVHPWMELPLWIPEDETHQSHRGLLAVSGKKAAVAGLTCRPVEETVHDTLAWLRERPNSQEWKAGLNPEKEKRLLQLWQESL
ncbi:NAD-dependent epimerase/dehydratase family protein [Desmospora profundinema]|uniref:2'-hydroxyisoflavone reductase n=1 Tax=Desmospora profundinema TaxID=1571184 RepID=A0ABU1IKW7_9BACL|nr:NAD-dependent epimerase/dehydratase family protein [Desmospora profundinema]MDR6225202.1 2'-hydroxyisoflavone reductase [Desmospora profundinema]